VQIPKRRVGSFPGFREAVQSAMLETIGMVEKAEKHVYSV
jgi:hypothetical protein